MGLKSFVNRGVKRSVTRADKVRSDGSNAKRCKDCGFRVRGKHHEVGPHHLPGRPGLPTKRSPKKHLPKGWELAIKPRR